MSQSGLFTENELPEHIHRYFDLKLDKDAFVRPTRDVVVEIYTRFLDKVRTDWKKSRIPGQSEPPLLIQMTFFLRMITSHYDNCYEFTITDLTNPTRKRTTTFLNTILLFKIEMEELMASGQQCEMKQAERQEGQQMLKREVSSRRVLLEELAFKKGQLTDMSERKDRIAAMRRELEVNKKAASRLAEEPARIKESLNKLNQAKQLKLITLQETASRIERDTQRQKLKVKEAELNEKLSLHNRDLDELKARNSLKRMEKQTEEQRLVRQMKQTHQKNEELKAKLDATSETAKKEIAQLEVDKKTYADQVNEYMARLSLVEGDTIKRFLSSRAIVDKSRAMMENYDHKLKEMTESPKDRTFIKPRV